jgi:hypothetical protein
MSEELARCYEPVLRFAGGENFYPMSVEDYLARCSLHRTEHEMVLPPLVVDAEALSIFNTPEHYLIYAAQRIPDEEEAARMKEWVMYYKQTRGPLDGLIEQATKLGIQVQRVFLPLNLPEEVFEQAKANYVGPQEHPPTYYYRALDLGGYQIIQYWFFYAFNDWATAHQGVNDHEADWEHIALFLQGGQPVWAAYASHNARGADLRRAWGEVEKHAGHPVVHVGAGSHASYFEKGTHHGVDQAPGDGLSIGPDEAEWQAAVDLSTCEWADDYQGLWGFYASKERISDWLLGGSTSPAGPRYERGGAERLAWKNPLAFVGLEG